MTRALSSGVLALLMSFAPVAFAQDATPKSEEKPGPAQPSGAAPQQGSQGSPEGQQAAGGDDGNKAERVRNSISIDPSLPDVEVTAMRFPRIALDLPYATELLEMDRERGPLYRSLPEALGEVAGVSAQKTSQGQGSPYIRGVTGYQTLLLVDGIRLNNSVFRSGPNQYWNTVDPFSLRRVEIVEGPASVTYGSDAVGAAVNAITLSPRMKKDDPPCSSRAFYRYSSAEQSHIGRVEAQGRLGEDAGLIAGFTRKEFGDLIGGKHVGLQPETGYQEWDADLKGVWKPAPHLALTAAVQHVTVDGAWRTHSTIYGIPWHGTAAGTDRRRVLDQQRDLGYLQAEWRPSEGAVRSVKASLSYQVQQEDESRVKSNGTGEANGFDAGTVGFWAQGEFDTPAGRVTAGFENYYDAVNSFSRTTKTDGSLDKVKIQGPVGDDASYDLLGAFVQDEIPLLPFLDAVAGGRFTWARADAKEVEDPVTKASIRISDEWWNLSGSLRLLVKPDPAFRVFLGASQGFRAPNLSDLTRFDTARSGEREVPSPGLEPERFLTTELGAKARWDPFSGQAVVFYTFLWDPIVRYPTGNLVGTEREVMKANTGSGYVYGVEAEGEARIGWGWSARIGFSWVEGMEDTYPSSTSVEVRTWMDKMPPMRGRVGVRWEDGKGRIWAEGDFTVSGPQDKLSPGDLRDTQRIPPGGSPGYALFGIRAGAALSDRVNAFAAGENLGNRDARVHGSGVNEPGANIALGLEIEVN